jgi:hypothetical protein
MGMEQTTDSLAGERTQRWDLKLNDSNEAILVRDALIEYKHILKKSPSERGQRLCKQADAIAQELSDRIIRYNG